MKRTAILTDFGTFWPSSTVERKLARLRLTKSGHPDRRFRSAKVYSRYERAVCAYVQGQWVAGNNGPFESPITDKRVILGFARRKGLV